MFICVYPTAVRICRLMLEQKLFAARKWCHFIEYVQKNMIRVRNFSFQKFENIHLLKSCRIMFSRWMFQWSYCDLIKNVHKNMILQKLNTNIMLKFNISIYLYRPYFKNLIDCLCQTCAETSLCCSRLNY